MPSNAAHLIIPEAFYGPEAGPVACPRLRRHKAAKVLTYFETFTREMCVLLATEASSLITQGVIHMQEKNLDEETMGHYGAADSA